MIIIFGGQFIKLKQLGVYQHLYSLGFTIFLLPYSYVFSRIPVRYFECKSGS